MQNIKTKLELYLEKEMKSAIVIKEDFEERYKDECKKTVTAIVNKVYEVLIHGRCISYYEARPDEFFKRELWEYTVNPCEGLITELFQNYTTDLFKIFETDLLDTIQEIKLETRNSFVVKILEYIHSSIISYYKMNKEKIIDMNFWETVIEYNSIISEYISLIKKEISSDNKKGICYKTYLRHLEDCIDGLIAELTRYVNHGTEDFHEKRIRYIYYYVKDNILTKF